jgi:hypothetical protein
MKVDPQLLIIQKNWIEAERLYNTFRSAFMEHYVQWVYADQDVKLAWYEKAIENERLS